MAKDGLNYVVASGCAVIAASLFMVAASLPGGISGNWVIALSAFVQAVATIVLVFITGRYAADTKKLAETAEKQIEQSNRELAGAREMRELLISPNAYVAIEAVKSLHTGYTFHIAIRNDGPGGAHNVKFSIQGNLKTFSGKHLSEANYMRNGFRYLAPDREFRTFLCNPQDTEHLVQNKEEIRIVTSCQSASGKTYENINVYKWDTFAEDIILSSSFPLDDMNRSVRDIYKLLYSIDVRLRIAAENTVDISWSDDPTS